MDLKKLTMELCAISGPSGFESGVYAYASDYLRPYADEIKTDALGNFMAIRRCGKPLAKTFLLDAHMDEIGFIITAVDKDGSLRFASLGGVDARMLPAREICVLSDPPIFGVIDTLPPHILKEEDMDKAFDADKLRIDVGMSQEGASKLCPPGTAAVFAGGCTELGEKQLCGKALDDRSCAAILLKAFEELSSMELDVDVCCLLSSQEEVGGRGAIVGAWNAEPDYAIVVDVTHAKTPDAPEVTMELGKGAAVGIGPNMNRGMTKELFRLAEEQGITCQPEVCPGSSGTNAEEIQVSRMGVATALISLPIKYMHTPVETACLDDMESILKLIIAYVGAQEVGG